MKHGSPPSTESLTATRTREDCQLLQIVDTSLKETMIVLSLIGCECCID